MRTLLCLLSIVGLLCVITACEGGPVSGEKLSSSPEPLKLEQVVVPAIQGKPVYTGQMFHYHENLSVTASGSISLGAGVSNVSPAGLSDPCGIHCPLPEGHRGALIGLVKESADDTFECVFEIGASLQGRPVCQGRLYLVVNDDSYRDNAGSFTVEFETYPLVRSSACRRACLKAQESSTKACKEACKTIPDEKEAFTCVRDCSQRASAAFSTCIEQDCTGQPDMPADCGQVCAQTQQATLDACISQCPPNTPENTCSHIQCAYGCLIDYHGEVGDCIVQTCHGERSMQDCAIATYNEFGACMAAHSPVACQYLNECLDSMPQTAYHCVTGLFPCDRHPDCL
ncbi:MAG: hypothetical protein GYA21_16835 [Myxococcales bacterium]|nr:hypothetical protein [Myxococcales bacterium]